MYMCMYMIMHKIYMYIYIYIYIYNKPLPQNILDHINKQTQEYFAKFNVKDEAVAS